MEKIKVLTTSPSIDINDIVSGIANLTRIWVNNNKQVEYIVFEAGKVSKKNKNIQWLLKQLVIPFQFLGSIVKNKPKIVHINMPLAPIAILRDFVFVLIGYLTNQKIVLHFRGGGFNLCNNIPLLYLLLIKLSIKMANIAIVLGQQEYNFWIKQYNIPAFKLKVIANCVESINSITHNKIDNSFLNILYLSRIAKNKGLIDIVNGLEKLQKKSYKLFVAGEGPELDWFKSICNQKINGNVEFCGVVFGKEKEYLLSHCNVFILPSYVEGLPNSLLEAMSFSLIPIVTPVGSIPNVVQHKKNGLVVDVRKPDDITDALNSLLINNSLFKTLSENALKTIENDYSLEKHLFKINDIYKSLI